MSKYNQYAQAIDTAFQEAREKFNGEVELLRESERGLEKVLDTKDSDFQYPGERNLKILAARQGVQNRETDIRNSTAWKTFDETVKTIDTKFHQALDAEYLMKHEQIDQGTIAALNSGLCTPDDLANFAKEFAANSTMRMIIGRAAKAAAEKLRKGAMCEMDNKTALKYAVVADSCNSEREAWEAAWSSILFAANTFSGNARDRRQERADFIISMASRWEECRDLINQF